MWTALADPFNPDLATSGIEGRAAHLRGTHPDREVPVTGYWCMDTNIQRNRVALDTDETGSRHVGSFEGYTWEIWSPEAEVPATVNPDPTTPYTWSTVQVDDLSPGDWVRATRTNDPLFVTEGPVARVRPYMDGRDNEVTFTRERVRGGSAVLASRRTFERRTTTDGTPAPDPFTWTPVDVTAIHPGDWVKAVRTDDPDFVTEGPVARVIPDAYDNNTDVRFTPERVTGATSVRSDMRRFELRSLNPVTVSTGDQVVARPTAHLSDPATWLRGVWQARIDDTATMVVDGTNYPTALILSAHLLFPVPQVGTWQVILRPEMDIRNGHRVRCDPNSTLRDSNPYEGIVTRCPADNPGAQSIQLALDSGRTVNGLSVQDRVWYTYTNSPTTDTPTEGEPPVTAPAPTTEWAPVRARDIREGDTLRLSTLDSHTTFPESLTGTVTRVNTYDLRVDLRVPEGTGTRLRRGLSIRGGSRAVERRGPGDPTTPATATPPPVVGTPATDGGLWVPVTSVAELAVGDRVRAHTASNQTRWEADSYVARLDYPGYDVVTNRNPGSTYPQLGYQFRHGIEKWTRPQPQWVPATRENVQVGSRIRGTLDVARGFEGTVRTLYPFPGRSTAYWGMVDDEVVSPGRWSFRAPQHDNVEVLIDPAAPVSTYRWEEVANRRDLREGDVIRFARDHSITGEFVRNDPDGDLAYNDAQGRRRYIGPGRTVEKRVDSSTPRDPRAPLANKDHKTLAGLKYAIYEFAKKESTSYGTGDNCDSGTNEFLAAAGLPRLGRDPLVNESAEIDALLRRIQEYLSRDSIGISREKADSYLELWDLPKAVRQRRITVTMMLDGTTTDAEVMERIPRVIRDATDLRVRAA